MLLNRNKMLSEELEGQESLAKTQIITQVLTQKYMSLIHKA